MSLVLKSFMRVLDDGEVLELSNDALSKSPIAHFFQISDIPIAIAQNLPFHFYWKDCHGVYHGSNDTQAKSCGFKTGVDVLEITDFDLAQSESAKALRKNDLEVMQVRKMRIIPEKTILKNGRFYSGWSYKWPLYSKTNKVMGILGISFNTHFGYFHLQAENPSGMLTTERERDCLYYLLRGLSAKGIARILNISHRTVEHHLHAAKIKMDCFSKENLIAKAWELPEIKNRFSLEVMSQMPRILHTSRRRGEC